MPDTIDVNTDDLDVFNDLFNGKTPEVEPEVKEPEASDDALVPEDDSLAPDNTDPEENEVADPDPEEDKQLLVPKKKTVQERINELTAKAREAERREADALRRLTELEAGKNKEPEVKAPVAVVGEPTPDDLLEDGQAKYPLGEYDPAYIRDLTKFTIEAENKAYQESLKQTEAQRQQQAERDALSTSWKERVTEVQERIPDFVEKGQELEATFTNLDPQYGEYLASTIMQLDNGPDVLYYLANNIEEAQQIAGLGPLKAAIALGGLDRVLAKTEAAPQPRITKAPEPPKSLNKGSSLKEPEDDEDLDKFSAKLFKKK